MWVQRAHCKPGAAVITEGTVTANGISVNRSWPQWEHRTGLPCALYCCGPIARCAAFQARFTALTVFLIIKLLNVVVAVPGRPERSPAQAPLRTVRESFPSHGSSLSMDNSRSRMSRLGKLAAKSVLSLIQPLPY